MLGSTLCGKVAADAVCRRWRVLSALSEDIRNLRIHMTSMLQPMRRALESSGKGLLPLVAEGMSEGCSAGEAWRKVRHGAVQRGGAADSLTEEDLSVLDKLFEQLGQSTREAQEGLIDAALSEIERQRESARIKMAEANRLYVSLGLLIGLMFAIIVI